MDMPIEHPPAPGRGRRVAALDPNEGASKVPTMSVEAQLRHQDWVTLTKQLTRYAFRITRKRSWEVAEDFAQQAIGDAFRFREDGWDPEKEPLLKHLCRRVRGIQANARRLKANAFEVSMRSALRSDHGGSQELDAASDVDPIDEVLDRQRLAAAYKTRLGARLAGDEAALAVVALHVGGVHSPEEQAEASGFTKVQILEARRRAYRNAKNVSLELAAELDAEDENEVVS